MRNETQGQPQQGATPAGREAKIRELTLAVAQGWYHLPDELLAAAIVKRVGATGLLETAPGSPAAP